MRSNISFQYDIITANKITPELCPDWRLNAGGSSESYYQIHITWTSLCVSWIYICISHKNSSGHWLSVVLSSRKKIRCYQRRDIHCYQRGYFPEVSTTISVTFRPWITTYNWHFPCSAFYRYNDMNACFKNDSSGRVVRVNGAHRPTSNSQMVSERWMMNNLFCSLFIASWSISYFFS